MKKLYTFTSRESTHSVGYALSFSYAFYNSQKFKKLNMKKCSYCLFIVCIYLTIHFLIYFKKI